MWDLHFSPWKSERFPLVLSVLKISSDRCWNGTVFSYFAGGSVGYSVCMVRIIKKTLDISQLDLRELHLSLASYRATSFLSPTLP